MLENRSRVCCFIYLGTHFVVDVLVICELMNVGVISRPYLLECTLCSRGLECCTVSKVCVQFLYTDGWSLRMSYNSSFCLLCYMSATRSCFLIF